MPNLDEAGNRHARRAVAWTVFLASAVWVAVGSAFLLRDLANGSLPAHGVLSQFTLFPPAAAFSIVGLIVALRQPLNACGWLMLAIGAISRMKLKFSLSYIVALMAFAVAASRSV